MTVTDWPNSCSACGVIGQPRSTQRLAPTPVSDDEAKLVEFLIAFSKANPRYGWRCATKAARRAGWAVNDKRAKRLWRLHGLRVPRRRRKKRLAGIGVNVGHLTPAE